MRRGDIDWETIIGLAVIFAGGCALIAVILWLGPS